MIFGLAFVASFAYLTKHQQYNAIINTYKSLHDEVKYALSVLIICAIFFNKYILKLFKYINELKFVLNDNASISKYNRLHYINFIINLRSISC
jgi:hypothetical protein